MINFNCVLPVIFSVSSPIMVESVHAKTNENAIMHFFVKEIVLFDELFQFFTAGILTRSSRGEKVSSADI